MRKKYIIMWDAGYGMNYDVVEAESYGKAEIMAYDEWKEEAESNATFSAMEYTDELAEEYGL